MDSQLPYTISISYNRHSVLIWSLSILYLMLYCFSFSSPYLGVANDKVTSSDTSNTIRRETTIVVHSIFIQSETMIYRITSIINHGSATTLYTFRSTKMCLGPIEFHPVTILHDTDINLFIIKAAQACNRRTLNGGSIVEPDNVFVLLVANRDMIILGVALVRALRFGIAALQLRHVNRGQRQIVSHWEPSLVQVHRRRC